MPDSQQELSSRYYWAEGAVWLLGGIMMAFGLVGLAPAQAIPILQISPADAAHVPRIIAVGLFLITLYMAFEWRTSPHSAKQIASNRWRFRIALLWIFSCFLISYPKLIQGTRLDGVSPFWYLGTVVIGYATGMLVSCIAFAALMIRAPEEAKVVGLPRVPIAARAQFLSWGPLVIFLFLVYYVLLYYSPMVGVEIASLFASITYLWVIAESTINLVAFSDPEGRRVPYRERIASFREIHNMHDYMRFMVSHGPLAENRTSVTSEDPPKETQRKIREKVARGCLGNQPNYRGVLLDEIQIKFCNKEENPDNYDVENRVAKIFVQGDSEFVRLRMIPFDQEIAAVDYRPQVEILERHAGEFLRSLPETGHPKVNVDEMMSYILQKTIEEVMIAEDGSEQLMLDLYIQRGDAERVGEILNRKPFLNARGIGGWTSLLHATANGYVEIVRMLLEAGANPDIANNLGLTPLMYGSRYENLVICKVLLEFGAKVNLQDLEGVTALMKACSTGNLDIVELFVRAGADLNIMNRVGQTALDIAHSCGQGSVAKLLRTMQK